MSLQSKNMNYIFNVEYFQNIDLQSKEDRDSLRLLQERNDGICRFTFEDAAPLEACREVEGYEEFALYTLYPGLLVGTGYPHEIALEGAMKLGFSFDYVTGLPYIPGSSLKGMLRSCFPGLCKDTEKAEEYTSMIRGLLGKADLDVIAFEKDVFEYNDIFLGAFPIPSESGADRKKAGTLLEMDYITSHKRKFKNPIPVSLLKVKPGVKFVFSFVLSDYCVDGMTLVSAAEKAALFKELILLMGIGAKTNTGFGKFAEEKPKANIECEKQAPVKMEKTGGQGKSNFGKCQGCGGPVKMDNRTGKPYRYCYNCNQKKR